MRAAVLVLAIVASCEGSILGGCDEGSCEAAAPVDISLLQLTSPHKHTHKDTHVDAHVGEIEAKEADDTDELKLKLSPHMQVGPGQCRATGGTWPGVYMGGGCHCARQDEQLMDQGRRMTAEDCWRLGFSTGAPAVQWDGHWKVCTPMWLTKDAPARSGGCDTGNGVCPPGCEIPFSGYEHVPGLGPNGRGYKYECATGGAAGPSYTEGPGRCRGPDGLSYGGGCHCARKDEQLMDQNRDLNADGCWQLGFSTNADAVQWDGHWKVCTPLWKTKEAPAHPGDSNGGCGPVCPPGCELPFTGGATVDRYVPIDNAYKYQCKVKV